jgi:hypothetical protein
MWMDKVFNLRIIVGNQMGFGMNKKGSKVKTNPWHESNPCNN